MNKERNPVGWFEIYVSDMARAKKFYETVLDVKLEPLPSPETDIDMALEMVAFPMAETDECGAELPGACGALAKMDGMEPGNSGTIVYFSCVDCAEDEARVAKAGGEVIQSKFSIGEYGYISLIKDTEGNTIGLHSNS